MKRLAAVLACIVMTISTAMARKACVIIRPTAGDSKEIVSKDSARIMRCPHLHRGTISYTQESELSRKIDAIDNYFDGVPLSQAYTLDFRDKKTNKLMGETVVGEQETAASLTGSEDTDQLISGIGAAVFTLILFSLLLVVYKNFKPRVLTTLLEVILGILTGGMLLLSILILAPLGFAVEMKVCGPTLLTGILAFAIVYLVKTTPARRKANAAKRKEKEAENDT